MDVGVLSEIDRGLLMVPTTRYARSGDATIAYQVAGEGALDLLFLPGWISQVEQLWELSAMRRFLERLAVFSRLILFDRRGSGLSDGVDESHTLDQEVRVLLNAAAELDVRDTLPRIRVPTLVMHRRADRAWDVRHSRYLAEHRRRALCRAGGHRLASVRVRGPWPSRAQGHTGALAAVCAARLRGGAA
jgi:pimeloyl-ACP methyl ester carboxylesterase